jgi:hypothetical protein
MFFFPFLFLYLFVPIPLQTFWIFDNGTRIIVSASFHGLVEQEICSGFGTGVRAPSALKLAAVLWV